jgi:hypothetical protein
MTSPIVKWTSPFSSGNEPITQEQYDEYFQGYLEYADRTWQKIISHGNPVSRVDEIIFQAALSPFEYWLRDTIKSERKAKENLSLPKK